jgi:hypothetical protein
MALAYVMYVCIMYLTDASETAIIIHKNNFPQFPTIFFLKGREKRENLRGKIKKAASRY